MKGLFDLSSNNELSLNWNTFDLLLQHFGSCGMYLAWRLILFMNLNLDVAYGVDYVTIFLY
jgi:hypothetical protein